ncbi:right-handed parallel beta-helix repeat-containing protein [Thermoflexus sp.]|uniref:right-handed parallel beta-helix repeat-containing protein n=1 Tax=Thermoflexus sp. TaxID=1969742 RepID=UPI002ADDC3E3|nr:right-handed parallel beta-helix repeat-containing protein [Thermoflexus sp.]
MEQITINRNRLSIRSADRSAVDPSADTTLRPEELAPAGVWIIGNDNTLEGFVIEDKAPAPPPHNHSHSPILVQGDRNTIRANRLIGRGNVSQADAGVLAHDEDVGNGVAEYNQILENEILNVSGHGIWILSAGPNRAAYSTVVARNHVHDNPGSGITIERSPYTRVEHNTLTRNGLALSLHSDSSFPGTGSIFQCNQISGNLFGARNIAADGPAMDARFNWWGNPGGPAHELRNPSGAGDRVGDNIEFAPWLTSPPGSVCLLIQIRIDIQPGGLLTASSWAVEWSSL